MTGAEINAAISRDERLLQTAIGVVSREDVLRAVEIDPAHRHVVASVDREAAAYVELRIVAVGVAHRHGRKVDLRAALQRKAAELAPIGAGTRNNQTTVRAKRQIRPAEYGLRRSTAGKTNGTIRKRHGTAERTGTRVGKAQFVRFSAEINNELAGAGKNIANRCGPRLVQCQRRPAAKRNRTGPGKPFDSLRDPVT